MAFTDYWNSITTSGATTGYSYGYTNTSGATSGTYTYYYPYNTYPITTTTYPYNVEVKPIPATPVKTFDLEKEEMKKENELLKKAVKRLLEANYGEEK